MKTTPTQDPPNDTMTDAPTTLDEALAKPARALDLSGPIDEGRIVVRTADTLRASWPFTLEGIKLCNDHLSKDGLDTLTSAFLWCIAPDHQMHMDEFAKRVGYDKSTLMRMYKGRYMGAGSVLLDVPKKLITETRRFLEVERNRAFGGKNEFVETPTARKIWRACELALESQTPVFVTGPSHIGKTEALRQFKDRDKRGKVIYCRLDAASGLGGMIRKLSKAMGNSDKGNTAGMKDAIKNALTNDNLVILDEVHLLQYTYRINSFFACVEVIRELQDEAKCGFVLCGTLLFLEKLNQGKNGEMEQLLNRGVHRCNLPKVVTTADLAAILGHWNLDLPEKNASVEFSIGGGGYVEHPYAVLKALAAGSKLKAITERLRYGRRLAAKAREPLHWRHFLAADKMIASEQIQDESGGWK